MLIDLSTFLTRVICNHLLTNNAPFKKGKTIVTKRVKIKTLRLPLTVLKNYYCVVIQINVDADLYQFKKMKSI